MTGKIINIYLEKKDNKKCKYIENKLLKIFFTQGQSLFIFWHFISDSFYYLFM